MIAQELNERLSQVGKGTPGGELLRRYWHPVAASVDLEREQVLPVRLLGENLALFRTNKGDLGLVQERCPHRSASLAYGIPGDDGIRCPYHGWYFNNQGSCLATPFDDVDGGSTLKDTVRVSAYPVEELGGLVFAYLGPQPAPLLPRWDLMVEEGKFRSISITNLPCNWLQCQENSLDPVHYEWLHAQQTNWLARKAGLPEPNLVPQHVKIAFDRFEFGILKRRLMDGQDPETSPDWNIGHPILFPNMLAGGTMQIRVPIDDTNTLHFLYGVRDLRPDEQPQETIEARDYGWDNGDGRLRLDAVPKQDFAAWIQQGPVVPRTLETLCKSDRGIVMFRKWLLENMEKVERGEDPDGLFRDPSQNEPFIVIPGMTGARNSAMKPVSDSERNAVMQKARELLLAGR